MQFPHSFAEIDNIFNDLKFSELEKIYIFKRVAVIFQLRDVQFMHDTSNNEVAVKEPSRDNITLAAELLNLPQSDLNDALVNRTIIVSGNEVK